MLSNKILCLGIILLSSVVAGCATYIEKHLYSYRIPIIEVRSVKDKIMSEGYGRVGAGEDFYWEGAVISNYEKYVSTQVAGRVSIQLSYKRDGSPSGHYRNVGVTVSNLGREKTKEVRAEIYRMEEILHKKLIEVAGEENVVRGWLKSK